MHLFYIYFHFYFTPQHFLPTHQHRPRFALYAITFQNSIVGVGVANSTLPSGSGGHEIRGYPHMLFAFLYPPMLFVFVFSRMLFAFLTYCMLRIPVSLYAICFSYSYLLFVYFSSVLLLVRRGAKKSRLLGGVIYLLLCCTDVSTVVFSIV